MQNGLTANQAKHTKNYGHCMRNLLKKPRSDEGKRAFFSTVPSGRTSIGDMNPAHCAGLISDVFAGTKAGLMLKWNF